jgi:predicted O-methyltransferase YrrM
MFVDGLCSSSPNNVNFCTMLYFKPIVFQLTISLAFSWIPKLLNHALAPHQKQFASNSPFVEATTQEERGLNMFGALRPILLPGENALGTMGVPTFCASSGDSPVEYADRTSARGLEGVLNQGPACMVDNVLSQEACQNIIQDCETSLGFGNYESGKNYHGALQILVSSEMANDVSQRLSRHIDISQVEALRKEMMQGSGQTLPESEDVRLGFVGLNRRWRIYRYDSNGYETFAPHIDAGFTPSGLSDDGTALLWDVSDPEGDEIVSRLTVLMYLNEDFAGGETNFYGPCSVYGEENLQLIASVKPKAGSCLLFPQGVGEEAVEYARQHWPLHEGSPVTSGSPKYVIRSDALFVTQREPVLLEDPLSCNDHLVREIFLPTSQSLNQNFLGHTSSLYNPHMGVENLGPLLYSFLRFTKKRRVVEIGAGYTSLWILQALKENDDELDRIRELQRTEKCKLLNYPWSAPCIVENYDLENSSLLCIDNCEHQKETATGASAVAKSLGLDSYFEFRKGDAFELELEANSIDVLWCDFGVGSRMADFCSSGWKSIRPGGFLLCHSTLTNENTRTWLEDVRSKSSQDITGIPPDECVELSLLEPHKHYQNSITLIQKRKSSDTGSDYEEPLYSIFA